MNLIAIDSRFEAKEIDHFNLEILIIMIIRPNKVLEKTKEIYQ